MHQVRSLISCDAGGTLAVQASAKTDRLDYLLTVDGTAHRAELPDCKIAVAKTDAAWTDVENHRELDLGGGIVLKNYRNDSGDASNSLVINGTNGDLEKDIKNNGRDDLELFEGGVFVKSTEMLFTWKDGQLETSEAIPKAAHTVIKAGKLAAVWIADNAVQCTGLDNDAITFRASVGKVPGRAANIAAAAQRVFSFVSMLAVSAVSLASLKGLQRWRPAHFEKALSILKAENMKGAMSKIALGAFAAYTLFKGVSMGMNRFCPKVDGVVLTPTPKADRE